MFSSNSRYSVIVQGSIHRDCWVSGGTAEGFLQAARTGKQPGRCGESEFYHTGYFGKSRGEGSALSAVQIAGTEMTLGGSLCHWSCLPEPLKKEMVLLLPKIFLWMTIT